MGGGGGGGGGGAQGPTIIKVPGGYDITNLTQLDKFDIFLANSLNVVENFITPTTAGVTVNGASYTLQRNQPVQVASNSTAVVYMTLQNVSYIPIEQTVSLRFYYTAVAHTQTQQKPLVMNTTSSHSTAITDVVSSGTQTNNTVGAAPAQQKSIATLPAMLIPAIGAIVAITAACFCIFYIRRRKTNDKTETKPQGEE
jgi:hypothetical protein